MVKMKESGDRGEKEVVDLILCPNCRSKLMLLPPSFPLFDIQCTRCLFRAQVKTSSNKPGDTILGAGWDIYEKVMKAGNLSPPLIINYHFADKGELKHEIRFYPFIPAENIIKRTLSPTARRANYRMIKYAGLSKLPYIILFSS